MTLPRYSECEYSLFVSYAHNDDEGYNGWVKALKDAFRRRLQQLPRDVPRLSLHLSGIKGRSPDGSVPSSSTVCDGRSAWFIVVGPQYVDFRLVPAGA
jgi:hypothetical protein